MPRRSRVRTSFVSGDERTDRHTYVNRPVWIISRAPVSRSPRSQLLAHPASALPASALPAAAAIVRPARRRCRSRGGTLRACALASPRNGRAARPRAVWAAPPARPTAPRARPEAAGGADTRPRPRQQREHSASGRTPDAGREPRSGAGSTRYGRTTERLLASACVLQ
eukprot:351748-Chlamydomonas_euryale.AAC.1